MERFCYVFRTVFLLISFLVIIDGSTECLAPVTQINGCTYQCKSPEYAFICENDGYTAYKCNKTCPSGRCVQTLCNKMSCGSNSGTEQYQQTYEKLCQGQSMQMHQSSSGSSRGLRFKQSSSKSESLGHSIYLNTLVPILGGGIVMGGILLLVRLCGRRGQVRMVESPPDRPEVIAQPQIRYPCQLLPLQFSSLQNPLYPINPQFLAQGGQFPNFQLAHAAGLSPSLESKSPGSTRSTTGLIANEARPGSSSPPSVDASTPKKDKSYPPLYAHFHVESDLADLPPAYDEVIISTDPTILEDDQNNPKSNKKD